MLKIVPVNDQFWPTTADQELCIGKIFRDRERQLCLVSRRSEIRFGRGSDFGLLKRFLFFDLRAIRSESSTAGFGMGSVSVADRLGRQKNC